MSAFFADTGRDFDFHPTTRRVPRPCVCVLCRHRAGLLTSCPLHHSHPFPLPEAGRVARPIAKRRAGFSAPPTPDLHPKRSPPIHHIQPVIALTDIPRPIRKNEIGLAKAELCPSPETDLQSARRCRTRATCQRSLKTQKALHLFPNRERGEAIFPQVLIFQRPKQKIPAKPMIP